MIAGRATVIDGDTIEIHGKRIRFDGIDAPESVQLCTGQNGKSVRCGARSAEALASYLVQSQPTRCRIVGTDQYGRLIGTCKRQDGRDISQWLVRNGHALDWPRHSGGRYQAYQQAAIDDRIGLWAGSFDEPWIWRKQQAEPELTVSRDTARSESASQPLGLIQSDGGDCRIKGNVSADGERIYHVPGQKYYERTTDQSDGRRAMVLLRGRSPECGLATVQGVVAPDGAGLPLSSSFLELGDFLEF
jgi:endonuclease YncB( thermonuclease family)